MSRAKTRAVGKPQPTAAAPRESRWVWGLPIALVTLACFAGAVRNGFVNWDDEGNFLKNAHYRGLTLEHLKWMFTTFHLGPYQPLSWMSLALDHERCGMDPAGYHRTSVLLHALNAALTYLLIATVLPAHRGRRAAAAAAALFFALHPLRVESVAWITERRDVLSQALLLVALLLYVRSTRERERAARWRALSIAAYAASLLAKASGMTVPLALLVLDRMPLQRTEPLRARVREKLPYFALALATAVVAWIGQREANAMRDLARESIAVRLGQALYGLSFYLWKTLVPAGLSPLYEIDARFRPLAWPYLPFVLATPILVAALLAWRRRHPAPWHAWLAYAILVAPVLGLAPTGPQIAADRYTYLATLPLAIALAAVVQVTLARTRWTLPIAAAALLGLALLTMRQVGFWHDSVTLWQRALALDDGSFLAHANLGFALDGRGAAGDVAASIAEFRRALAMHPDDLRVRHTLGLALAKQRDYEHAIAEWQQVVARDPRHADALYSLGLASDLLGRTEDAIRYWRLTLAAEKRFDDVFVRTYDRLGETYAKLGRRAEAIECWKGALALDQNDPEARARLRGIR